MEPATARGADDHGAVADDGVPSVAAGANAKGSQPLHDFLRNPDDLAAERGDLRGEPQPPEASGAAAKGSQPLHDFLRNPDDLAAERGDLRGKPQPPEASGAAALGSQPLSDFLREPDLATEGADPRDEPAPEMPPLAPRPLTEPVWPGAMPAPTWCDEPSQSFVLIGPAGAGKTCVLAAMTAACYTRAGDTTLGLSIVCDGEDGSNERLQQDCVDWIGYGAPPSRTLEETVYALEIAARRPGGLLGRPHLEVRQVRCIDEPGELCFPARGNAPVRPPISARQIHQLADASALALVVDATQPLTATIEANLPRLLDRIATSRSGEPLPQSRVARVLSRLGLLRGRPVPRRTRLSARRVLLLLTKIDVLASAMAHELADKGIRVSPAEIAWAIDPLALAIELVGERTLWLLRRAISADADLAVGVCSASGFCGDHSRAFSAWSRGQSPDERVRAWAPFGVREAVQYLTLGRCERTIELVTDAELSSNETFEVHDYTFQEAP